MRSFVIFHPSRVLAALAVLAAGCGTSAAGVVPGASDGGAAADADPVESGTVGPATCAAKPPAALELPSVDLLGHPPYAAYGCTLVYVAATAAGAGDLRVRDLSTGNEIVLAPASESPRRPTIAGDVIAWEAKENGRAVVRVHGGGATFTPAGAFDHAGEPRAAVDAVAFTAWSGADALSDTDVMVVDVASRTVRTVLGGPGQQRFADISKGTLAATDFSEDPDGTFNDNETDQADIILFDRVSSAVTRRPRAGKQAFPILATAARLGYLDWALVHPEPKLSQYALRVGDLAGRPEADVELAIVTDASGQYVLPSGQGGVIMWIDRPLGGSAALWQAPVDLSRPAAIVPGLAGRELFAPAVTGSFTFLGTRAAASSTVLLTAVTR